MKSNNNSPETTPKTPIVLQVTGMDCASCALTVENGVKNLPGVSACLVNFAAETITVEGNVSKAEVVSRITQLGYGAQEKRSLSEGPAEQENFLGFVRKRRETLLAAIGMIFILPGIFFRELIPFLGDRFPWIDFLSLVALILAGGPIARSAWRALRVNREVNINVLMTIAAIGAVAIGDYTEAGMVMILFAIGEALEGYSTQKARLSLRALIETVPPKATVLRPCMDCQSHLGQDGYLGGPCPFCGVEPHLVDVNLLQVGETILVKPGEKIAMDGEICAGRSSVNQAAITGESLPLPVSPGDRVFAGSINGEGALEIKVTQLVADNTIHRIIRLVEKAQENRAPAQQLVDRFARVYTPLVVALAIGVAILPPVLFQAPFFNTPGGEQGWLYRALQLLVIACPCALVLSTPVSMISAISNAARNGILFKGGQALEALSQVKILAFDKTGTLTEGKPQVESVRSIGCIAPGETSNPDHPFCDPCSHLLSTAAAVEQRSHHPLANAVVEAAGKLSEQYPIPSAEDVRVIPGVGVYGRVNGQKILLGSHTYFDQNIPHNPLVCQELETITGNGEIPILVSRNDEFEGYITVKDNLRSSSHQALANIMKTGIEQMVILSGDNQITAEMIARQLGVTQVKANLLPEQKMSAIQELTEKYQFVGMVGDGINDTPALALASVGIAIGAAGGGTAQAMETANVVIMSDQLDGLNHAIRLSKATMQKIAQNIWLSVGVKGMFLLLAILGLGTMWLAVLADMGISLIVILNGLQLVKFSSEE